MGTSLKWVSERLGHASVEVTANWYSWALPSGDRSVADRLDSALVIKTTDVVTDEADPKKVAVGESRKRVVTKKVDLGDQSTMPSPQVVVGTGADGGGRTHDLLITKPIRANLSQPQAT
jgi:hypothetical protein